MPITTASKEARKLFIEGRELAEYWQTEKANGLFNKAIEIDPEFALAYLFKAGTASDAKEYKEARAKAIALSSKVSAGEQKLIAANQAVEDENNATKANEIYLELAAMFPKDKRVQLYLASTYDGLQQYDKEIAALENAIALDKNFAPAYETLGYVHRWKNQFDKAEANFKEYLRLNPKLANGHDNLADLYLRMGRFDEAMAQYQESFRIDPSLRYSRLNIGITYAFMGNYDEGRKTLQALMDGETKPAFKLYDQQLIARTYMYEGDYAKAHEATDKALQMAQELGLPEQLAYNNEVKFVIFFAQNDWDKAEASIGEVARLVETADLTPATKENYGVGISFWQTLVAAGRKDFAAAQAKVEECAAKIAAIKNPAMQKYSNWLRGYIALAQGEAAKAVEYLGQGEVDDAFFMYNFAEAKEKTGDAAGAADLYKKVANWNLDGLWYPLVRAKAKAKI